MNPLRRLGAPVVHPWMRRPADVPRGLAEQLDQHLARLDAAIARGRALGASTGGTPEPADPLADVREAVRLARDAFAGLALAMDEHGPPLEDLLRRWESPHPREWRGVRAAVRARTDALSEADVLCRRTLERAIRLVPDTETVTAGPGWLAALGLRERTPAGAAGLGDRLRGRTGDAAHARRVLADAPPGDIADLLRLHPETARALGEAGSPPPGPAPGMPSRLADAARDPEGLARVDAVRAACAAAPADEARRSALLWPDVVGALDGAPAALRAEANRLLVRAELGRARRRDVELEARAIALRVTDGRRRRARLRGRLLDAWLSRDRLTALASIETDRPLLVRADLRARIRLYEEFLFDRVPDGRGGTVPRRLLLFRPAGRGRVAELRGTLDADTETVVVLVPGTGSAIRGFHLPARIAADLAAADAGGGVAAVAWMGTDFPASMGTHAPFVRYALAAGAPLAAFVAGLDVPAGVPVAVVGHSYGGVMVGAAELAGLSCDRVVHVSSAGAGPNVTCAADYPGVDPRGRPRDPSRFTLTAPGDPIRWVQKYGASWTWLPPRLAGVLRRGTTALGLGVDPARLDGTTVLEAGTWEAAVDGHAVGDPVEGPAAHADVLRPGTAAFRRIVEAARGREPG